MSDNGRWVKPSGRVGERSPHGAISAGELIASLPREISTSDQKPRLDSTQRATIPLLLSRDPVALHFFVDHRVVME